MNSLRIFVLMYQYKCGDMNTCCACTPGLDKLSDEIYTYSAGCFFLFSPSSPISIGIRIAFLSCDFSNRSSAKTPKVGQAFYKIQPHLRKIKSNLIQIFKLQLLLISFLFC